MRVLKHRTIAGIYPHLSLEAMIQLDNNDIIYSNISVNKNGEKEKYCEDSHWTYTVPLTEVDWNNVDKYYYKLDSNENLIIGHILLELWNSNPIFNNNPEWTFKL